MIKAPKDVGGANQFEMMPDELGESYVRGLLQVSRQQIAAWRRPGALVPRATVLAMYWESRWGRSLVDAEREAEVNNLRGLAQAQAQMINILETRINVLCDELRREDPRHTRCANDLWFDRNAPPKSIRTYARGRSKHPQLGEFS